MAPKPIGRYYELREETTVPDPYVLTSKIKIAAPTRTQMKALRAASTEEEVERAFLGDQAEEVFELYKDRPDQEWEAFVADLRRHFFGPGIEGVEGKSEPSST